MIARLLFVCVLLCMQNLMYSQWKIHHILPNGYTLNAVTLDSVTKQGMAVGRFGVVQTIDGDTTDYEGFRVFKWVVSRIETEYELRTVRRLKINEFVVGGDKGSLFKTTDYGKTWRPIPTSITSNIVSLTFSNSTDGVAVTDNGITLYTTNAGDSWTVNSQQLDASIHKVLCANDTTWIAFGECKNFYFTYFISRDLKTWKKTIDSSVEASVLRDGDIVQTDKGPKIYIAGDNWFLYNSTDYGASWNKVEINEPSAVGNSYYQCYGFAVGKSDRHMVFQGFDPSFWSPTIALFSSNGGDSWTNERRGIYAAPADGCRDYEYYNDISFMAVGFGGNKEEVTFYRNSSGMYFNYRVYRTLNGIPNTYTLYRLSPNRIATLTLGSFPHILISNNNAVSWEKLEPFKGSLNLRLRGIASPIENRYIVVADSHYLEKIAQDTWQSVPIPMMAESDDGGKTWRRTLLQGYSMISGEDAMKFFDASNGVRFHYGNVMWVTNNGGVNWNRQELKCPEHCFIQTLHRVVSMREFEVSALDTVSRFTRFFKTTDQGATWSELDEDKYIPVKGPMITSPNGTLTVAKLVMAQDNKSVTDSLWISKNNGVSWDLIRSVSFSPNDTGYVPQGIGVGTLNEPYGAYGTRDKFFYTTNSGASWQHDVSEFKKIGGAVGVRDIEYLDDKRMLFSSGERVLFEFNPAGLTSDIDFPPNPSPALGIEIESAIVSDLIKVRTAANSVISLFSVDGSLIQRISTEPSVPYVMSTANLSSGVYVLQAVVSGKQQTFPIRIVR